MNEFVPIPKLDVVGSDLIARFKRRR